MNQVLNIVTSAAMVQLEDIDFFWTLRPSPGWLVQLREGVHLGAHRFPLRVAPELAPLYTPLLCSCN